jgi:phenylacetate-CoA oxygenase PaaH subunit
MIWEVFRQERDGAAFAHAGSLEAADEAFARAYAHELYGRRNESRALWLVPRTVDEFVDEFERNYRRVDGYSLKSRLREARERAGTQPD